MIEGKLKIRFFGTSVKLFSVCFNNEWEQQLRDCKLTLKHIEQNCLFDDFYTKNKVPSLFNDKTCCENRNKFFGEPINEGVLFNEFGRFEILLGNKKLYKGSIQNILDTTFLFPLFNHNKTMDKYKSNLEVSTLNYFEMTKGLVATYEIHTLNFSIDDLIFNTNKFELNGKSYTYLSSILLNNLPLKITKQDALITHQHVWIKRNN